MSWRIALHAVHTEHDSMIQSLCFNMLVLKFVNKPDAYSHPQDRAAFMNQGVY